LSEEKYKEIFVRGSITVSPWRVVNIYVNPCTLPVGCKTGPEIDAGETRIFVLLPSASFRPKNLNDPVQFSANYDRSIVAITSQTVFRTIKFRQLEVEDDRVDFLGPKTKASHVMIDRVETETRPKLQNDSNQCDPTSPGGPTFCEPYLILKFESGEKKTIYTRQFPKILATLGTLGGFAQLMTVIFTFLYFYQTFYTPQKEMKKEILGQGYKN
jgi:hypothetical protein